MLNEELDTVKELYDEGKTYGAPLNRYYPPVAGTLLWLTKLRKRIEKPIEKFQHLDNEIITSEDGQHVLHKANDLFSILEDEQNTTFDNWCKEIPGAYYKKNLI